MSTVAIGPLSLPIPLLAIFIAIGASWWLSERLGRRRGLSVEPDLYLLLATGLVGSALRGKPARLLSITLASLDGTALKSECNVLLDADSQASLHFNERALAAALFSDARNRLVATRVGELSAATFAECLAAPPSKAQTSP